MGVTTIEIAKICGVSRGTVDRVLNNRSGVNPQTREKVLQAAQQLGYRPHFIARSLAKGRTMTIGVVVFDLKNSFFTQLVNSIEARAREAGYFVYLTLTNKDAELEKKCLEHLAGRQVDGLILCPVNKGKAYEEYLTKLDIPVVAVANRLSRQIPYVGIDDCRAMKDAVKYVLEKGYREIVYISPALSSGKKVNIYAQQQRYLGLQEAVKTFDGNVDIILADTKEFKAVLDKMDFCKGERRAILCSSDIYALETLSYFKARELGIPHDAGLMGFDSIEMLKYVEPAITTVSYPIGDIGQKAMDVLIGRMEGHDARKEVILEHRIVQGTSL